MASGELWEVEVFWRGTVGSDPRSEELRARIASWFEGELRGVQVSDLYFVAPRASGEAAAISAADLELAALSLFSDPLTQGFVVRDVSSGSTHGDQALSDFPNAAASPQVATILQSSGVMDPVEASILKGLNDLGWGDMRARTGKRVLIDADLDSDAREVIANRVLSNAAIQEVYWNDDPLPAAFPPAQPYEFAMSEVPLAALSDDDLSRISRDGQLSLSLAEMQTIRGHFESLGRAPTDIELETIAQTWSEHCCHKTLTARIDHRLVENGVTREFHYDNLLMDTIGKATRDLMEEEDPAFCLSVFKDNAGVIAFDDEYGISFKVETHNHPSAIEPYGGAGTGIGGVLRDTLGTGLGAKPIVNTDVFCLGPPDLPKDRLPSGVLHPRRVLSGVVGGVRDYGNRMGIPTASGGLFFDERYTTNPLVYAGSLGIIPRDCVEKEVLPGDRIVVLGGRTGRDGIHGATFSSVELTEDSETVSSGAVQIGDAITEKKVLDVLLEARDRHLFRGVTDCGAGGLSSAVGEMGEETGARVVLDSVPLKYEGLSYWEIWISEAQERMVFAVPPENLEALLALAESEDVECSDIGEFTGTGQLELLYEGHQVADLDMHFLHKGRPVWVRQSTHSREVEGVSELPPVQDAGKILRGILSAPNVASKEWVIRQYDHEVQGRSVLKPFQGPGEGPGDGVAFMPRLGSLRGIVIGCGMNPCYGDLDPYRMALSAIDESVRNVVCAGGDPDRTAILDNFCWGNTEREETLGTIVEASRGCHDAAIALGTPFVSGKDSLNNEFRVGDRVLSIPPSLLISSVAIVDDARRLVSMDLKSADSKLLLVGATRSELGGSHLLRVTGGRGGEVPDLPDEALAIHRAIHRWIQAGLVRSCHDLSEGGLAVAAAEMAFSGRLGVELRLGDVPGADALTDIEILFSESNSRYLVEASEEQASAILEDCDGLPVAMIGESMEYHIFRVLGRSGETVLAEPTEELRECWRSPLAFS